MDSADDLADGLRDYFGAFVDILLDEDMCQKVGMDPEVRQKLLEDLQQQADWKEAQMGALQKSQR